MDRRRFLALLGAAPVALVACDPRQPSPLVSSGSGGVSVAGQAEDWHYVGEAGEPAFGTGWGNGEAQFQTAFRIRESGIVDIQGHVVTSNNPASTETVFTLPEGYRPSGPVGGVVVGVLFGAAAPLVPVFFYVTAAGEVMVPGSSVDPFNAPGSTRALRRVYLNMQVYLTPPTTP